MFGLKEEKNHCSSEKSNVKKKKITEKGIKYDISSTLRSSLFEHRSVPRWPASAPWSLTLETSSPNGNVAHLSPVCQGEMWKRWRHHFPHYKSMGAFCCQGNQSFDQIYSKTLCSLSLTPMMIHIKFDQYWPTSYRDIQVQKCEILKTPKWVVWFGPKSNSNELLCPSWLLATLMMIQSKMKELAWRHHFPIISLWVFLDAQEQLTP